MLPFELSNVAFQVIVWFSFYGREKYIPVDGSNELPTATCPLRTGTVISAVFVEAHYVQGDKFRICILNQQFHF